MDPVFLPRTFIHVDRLPRSDVGKLPRAALDDIHARRGSAAGSPIDATQQSSFSFCVAADHPSLAGHFPGHPVVPGVLLIDHVLDAVRRMTGQQIARLPRVKFTTALLPDEQAQVRCEFDGARVTFRVTVRRAGVAFAVAEGMGLFCTEPQP